MWKKIGDFLFGGFTCHQPHSPDPRPAPARPQRDRHVTDFIALAQQARDAGLMKRDIAWYVGRMIRLGLGFAAVGVMFVMLGHSWWQMLTAVLLGFMCTQVGFLSHDAAHRQIFASAKKNEWAARITGNLFVGLSYGWWMNKHGKHHANPTRSARTTTLPPAPSSSPRRTRRPGPVSPNGSPPHQGYFFFPLLTLVALDLHISAIRRVLQPQGDRAVPRRRNRPAGRSTDRCPGGGRAGDGPVDGLAFVAVQIITLGVYMGGAFAPNHKGMPLVPKDVKIDFMRRQTLMSRNIKGGWWVDAGMGGLNYQIEHHLFPTMSSKNLKLVQPMVREYCAERHIAYTETTLTQSYMIVMRYLNRVGLGQRDPSSAPSRRSSAPRGRFPGPTTGVATGRVFG